jgi:hypothetical protein
MGCGKARTVTLQLTCDPSARSGGAKIVKVYEPRTCNYVLEMQTEVACHPAAGMGSLATLFIILCTLFVIYCAVGVWYNRTKLGVTDWKESIPHVEFWIALPGHVWVCS